MKYFTLREIIYSLLAFYILGVSSVFGWNCIKFFIRIIRVFFDTFLKCLRSAVLYISKDVKNEFNIEHIIQNVLKFVYCFLVSLVFVIIAYVYMDGMIRMYGILVFGFGILFGLFLTKKTAGFTLLICEKMLLVLHKLFLFVFRILLIPVKAFATVFRFIFYKTFHKSCQI